MKDKKDKVENETTQPESLNNSSRRGFLGHLTKAGIVAAAVGVVGAKPFLGGKDSIAEAAVADYNSSNRTQASFNYRISTATAEKIDVGD